MGESRPYKKETQEHGASILDPLQWLSKKNRKTLPKLSKMALTIFVIQGFSADSERHYSVFNARHIMTPLRNRLWPNVVEAIVCFQI